MAIQELSSNEINEVSGGFGLSSLMSSISHSISQTVSGSLSGINFSNMTPANGAAPQPTSLQNLINSMLQKYPDIMGSLQQRFPGFPR